jgi:hypothetical protein
MPLPHYHHRVSFPLDMRVCGRSRSHMNMVAAPPTAMAVMPIAYILLEGRTVK